VSNLIAKSKQWTREQVDKFNAEQACIRRAVLSAMLSEDHNAGLIIDKVSENTRSKTYRLRKPLAAKNTEPRYTAAQWEARQKQLSK